MQEWKIQRSDRSCRRCGRDFPGGDTFYSAIHERGSDEFERRDLCLDCWPAATSEEEEEPPFSFWKTRMPTLKERPRIAYGQVQEFFWRLVDRRGETGEASHLLYPLALLLLRRKVLRLTGTSSRGGREILAFTEVSGEREIEIEDPGLDAEGLARLDAEVRDLLFPDRAARDSASDPPTPNSPEKGGM